MRQDQPREQHLSRRLRREIEGLALSVPSEGHVHELIDGKLDIRAEIPSISKISDRSSIQAVICSRDVNRNSCQWNLEIGHRHSLSAGFILSGHADNDFVKLTGSV